MEEGENGLTRGAGAVVQANRTGHRKSWLCGLVSGLVVRLVWSRKQYCTGNFGSDVAIVSVELLGVSGNHVDFSIQMIGGQH